jgi:hypothetical protein
MGQYQSLKTPRHHAETHGVWLQTAKLADEQRARASSCASAPREWNAARCS